MNSNEELLSRLPALQELITAISSDNELYENGMIDDAKKFRNYLGDYCKQHNKEIRVGTYTITKGMTYEEIAKKITKS